MLAAPFTRFRFSRLIEWKPEELFTRNNYAKLGVMVSPYYFNSDFIFSLWLHPPKNVSNHYLELLLTKKIKTIPALSKYFFGGWKTLCD